MKTKQDLLESKEVILLSSNDTTLIKSADIVLPIASFLEKDGSYTNIDDVTQHIKSTMRKNAPAGTLISLWQEIESLSKEEA